MVDMHAPPQAHPSFWGAAPPLTPASNGGGGGGFFGGVQSQMFRRRAPSFDEDKPYKPQPLSTSNVALRGAAADLMELLGKNIHEVTHGGLPLLWHLSTC